MRSGPSRRGGAWVRSTLTYPFRLEPAGGEWRSTPFTQLAALNVLSAAGDALVAVALAGSVFVSVPLNAARGRTAIGLVCTMLPFAVVAPFVGPLMDRVRRGRQAAVFLAGAGRVAAAVLMGWWIHSLLLFPAAFLSLVCAKTHAVARASLVPAVTGSDAGLVRANSRLTVGAGVASALAAAFGAGVYRLLGPVAVLDVDAVVFVVVAVLALGLPRPPAPPPRPAHRAAGTPPRTYPPPVVTAAVAMGGMRAMTGFLTALVAFGFRAQAAPVVWYGAAAVGGIAGGLAGAALAPPARRLIPSRAGLVASSLVVAGVTAAAVTRLPQMDRRVAAVVLATAVGLAGTLAKTAFDAIVQTDVPADARGKAFARLEALFQLAWVACALVPTLVTTPLFVGFVVIAVVLGVLGVRLGISAFRSGR